MEKRATYTLIAAAFITFLTALAHLSCLILGPTCYQAQMAPPFLVQSASEGTWIAPVANILVSGVFIVWGLYALSAARIVPRLPLLGLVMYLIAGVCLLRGAMILPLSLIFPERTTVFAVLAGCAWFLTGCLFLYGYRTNSHK